MNEQMCRAEECSVRVDKVRSEAKLGFGNSSSAQSKVHQRQIRVRTTVSEMSSLIGKETENDLLSLVRR